MRKKENKIKKIADSELNGLIDEDFQARIIRENYPEKQKNVKSGILRAMQFAKAALVWLVIAAVIVPCVLLPVNIQEGTTGSGTPEEEEPPRFGDSLDSTFGVESSLDEVNAELQGYHFYQKGIKTVEARYDKKTGEKLYYNIGWNNNDDFDAGLDDTLKYSTIHVVVNENFEGYSWWILDWTGTFTVNGLTVQYNCQRDRYYPEDGVYDYIYYAMIQLDNVKIYFEPYSCLSYYDDNGFEKFVSELLVPVSETEPAYVSE